MTPSHTRKKGRIYRYYLCVKAPRRGHASCPVRSVAAAEIEGAVTAQVKALLATPEIIARTIAAAHAAEPDGKTPAVRERDIAQALGPLDPLWDELFPAEQARILGLMVERIDVNSEGIDLRLRADGSRSLAAELRANLPEQRLAS